MSVTKVALAGLAALAGPMMYVADPVRPERQPPVSEPRTIAERAERPAAVREVRPGVRVILASPFDPPGTRQEAAPVSSSPGVPEVLYARQDPVPAPAVKTALGQETEPVVTRSRKKVRTAARASRTRQPSGFFRSAPFFAWLR
jgi:hypothetical protein